MPTRRILGSSKWTDLLPQQLGCENICYKMEHFLLQSFLADLIFLTPWGAPFRHESARRQLVQVYNACQNRSDASIFPIFRNLYTHLSRGDSLAGILFRPLYGLFANDDIITNLLRILERDLSPSEALLFVLSVPLPINPILLPKTRMAIVRSAALIFYGTLWDTPARWSSTDVAVDVASRQARLLAERLQGLFLERDQVGLRLLSNNLQSPTISNNPENYQAIVLDIETTSTHLQATLLQGVPMYGSSVVVSSRSRPHY
jgi:hypothetical protein